MSSSPIRCQTNLKKNQIPQTKCSNSRSLCLLPADPATVHRQRQHLHAQHRSGRAVRPRRARRLRLHGGRLDGAHRRRSQSVSGHRRRDSARPWRVRPAVLGRRCARVDDVRSQRGGRRQSAGPVRIEPRCRSIPRWPAGRSGERRICVRHAEQQRAGRVHAGERSTKKSENGACFYCNSFDFRSACTTTGSSSNSFARRFRLPDRRRIRARSTMSSTNFTKLNI